MHKSGSIFHELKACEKCVQHAKIDDGGIIPRWLPFYPMSTHLTLAHTHTQSLWPELWGHIQYTQVCRQGQTDQDKGTPSMCTCKHMIVFSKTSWYTFNMNFTWCNCCLPSTYFPSSSLLTSFFFPPLSPPNSSARTKCFDSRLSFDQVSNHCPRLAKRGKLLNL